MKARPQRTAAAGRRPPGGEAAEDRPGQDPADVAVLGGQRVGGADQAGDGGLGDTFGVAAGLEVAPARPLGGDVLVDHARGVIQQPRLERRCRMRMASSVSSQPSGRAPSRPSPSVKPPTSSNTSRRKDMLAPMRFRTGSGPAVVLCSCSRRPSGTPAARGAPRGEAREHRPADAHHLLGPVAGGQPLQPVGAARASSSTKATTSPVARVRPLFLAPDSPAGRGWGSPASGEGGRDPPGQLWTVVDGHDCLGGRPGLGAHRGQRGRHYRRGTDCASCGPDTCPRYRGRGSWRR